MSLESTNPSDLIPLRKAIQTEIPTAVAISTIWRWATKGLAPATDGDPRIKLEVLYVGNRPHTTKAAIREFLELATKARLTRIELKQQRCREVTDAELADAGLL
jgi:hypothetical protein